MVACRRPTLEVICRLARVEGAVFYIPANARLVPPDRRDGTAQTLRTPEADDILSAAGLFRVPAMAHGLGTRPTVVAPYGAVGSTARVVRRVPPTSETSPLYGVLDGREKVRLHAVERPF